MYVVFPPLSERATLGGQARRVKPARGSLRLQQRVGMKARGPRLSDSQSAKRARAPPAASCIRAKLVVEHRFVRLVVLCPHRVWTIEHRRPKRLDPEGAWAAFEANH